MGLRKDTSIRFRYGSVGLCRARRTPHRVLRYGLVQRVCKAGV